MAYLSESILDDVESREFSAASQIQQQQSSSFSKDIHPGEWQYCVCVEWEPWIEDVLLTYASAFNIYMIQSVDDLKNIRGKIRMHNMNRFDIGFNEYALIEFNADDRNVFGVQMIMLMVMSIGQVACCIVKSESDNTFYEEKRYSNSSVSSYIRQMLRGFQKDSRYIETIGNKIYQLIRPNGHSDWMKMKCHDFVKKMNRLYKKRLSMFLTD